MRLNYQLAGVHGFEPWKCQIQSLVPYRLAIPQFLQHDNSNVILLVCQGKYDFYTKKVEKNIPITLIIKAL